jgi:3-oxoacyl-(acyl-carrier-protein) synthase
MPAEVVITGVGMVTAFGAEPDRVVDRILRGESAACATAGFDRAAFGCPVAARIAGFDPVPYVAEPKLVRLMSRDAQLAVAAARLALRDARVVPGETHAADAMALFGATGLAGVPVGEVRRLIEGSGGPDGRFDPVRFGQTGLRAVSPMLSFKILANMPVCLIGINEGLRGPNAIYTPWEGNGVQAIEAGLDALGDGDAACALVGGCDAKVHPLAFLALAQQGRFDSWRSSGCGVVPGEGAVFLVLETVAGAAVRRVAGRARVRRWALRTRRGGAGLADVGAAVLRGLADPEVFPVEAGGGGRWLEVSAIVSSADGDPAVERDEAAALEGLRIRARTVLRPKVAVGHTFAAAAALQVAVGSVAAGRFGGPVVVLCLGHGSEQAAFLLEGVA